MIQICCRDGGPRWDCGTSSTEKLAPTPISTRSSQHRESGEARIGMHHKTPTTATRMRATLAVTPDALEIFLVS